MNTIECSIVFITAAANKSVRLYLSQVCSRDPQAHLAVYSELGFAEMSKLEANADGVVTVVSLRNSAVSEMHIFHVHVTTR